MLLAILMLFSSIGSEDRHSPVDLSSFNIKRDHHEGREYFRKKGEYVAIFPDQTAVIASRRMHISPVDRTRARAVTDKALLVEFDEENQTFESAKADALRAGAQSVEPNIVFECASDSRENMAARNKVALSRIESSHRKISSAKTIDIGIFDTGINGDVDFLEGIAKPGFDAISGGQVDRSMSDPNGHGTQVASTILATYTKRYPNAGKQLKLHSVRVIDESGYATLSSLLEGLEWARSQHFELINMSFSGSESSPTLERMIERLQMNGSVIIAAAGNGGGEDKVFPADLPGVIAIGAVKSDGRIEEYSNWGKGVDLYSSQSTWEVPSSSQSVQVFAGTSASAAYVTGLAAIGISSGSHNSEIERALKKASKTIITTSNLESQRPNVLNEQVFLSLFDEEANPTLVVRQFEIIKNQTNQATVVWKVENGGMKSLPSSSAAIEVRSPNSTKTFSIGGMPRLASGYVASGEQIIDLKSILGENERVSTGALRLSFSLLGNGEVLQSKLMDWQLGPGPNVTFTHVSMSPQKFDQIRDDRVITVKLFNSGNAPLTGATLHPFYWHGVHEAVYVADTTIVGDDLQVSTLLPGEAREIRIPAPRMGSIPSELTLDINLVQNGSTLVRGRREYVTSSGGFRANYAQALHRDIVDKAVKLLDELHLLPPDLHRQDVDYVDGTVGGDKTGWTSLPTQLGFPSSAAQGKICNDVKDWTDATFSALGLSPSMKDGAHDADEYDVAYCYQSENTWDTHFWIVDNNDDDGLNYLGLNHHSALTKVRTLMYGDPSSKLPNGSITHYKMGNKLGAYYLLGHALHLIGDMSLGSHTNEENKHGVYGDVYHDWMDKGNYVRFNDVRAWILDKGLTFIDPYQDEAKIDPVRFLTYTTAQVGNSFPWHSTIDATHFGKGGNRVASGNLPNYPNYMSLVYGSLPNRPQSSDDISKNEVIPLLFGSCSFDDVIFPSKSADCNGDGFVDLDNTDMVNNAPSDQDGDISRIASASYPYAIRAAAGLLYYFFRETYQYGAMTPSRNNLLL